MQQVHYIDMANYVRGISKDAKKFEQLPEFIQNLANLVFLMNDRKGNNIPFSFWIINSNSALGDGKWDVEEYRNGSVGWCRYVTEISQIDAAYEALLTVRFVYIKPLFTLTKLGFVSACQH